MSDVEFCKQRLCEIVEYSTAANLQSKVQEFLKARLPSSPAERAALKVWALGELGKLERIPGGGTSKPVPLGELDATSRMMATLQTVLDEIEAKEAAEAPASFAQR
jgi:hypothetical protein